MSLTALRVRAAAFGIFLAFGYSPISTAATETILYRFQGGAKDGAGPTGSLAIGPDGALYGVTAAGGSQVCGLGPAVGCGVAFKLTPPRVAGGQWAETILHKFGFNDEFPGDLALGADGKFYGNSNGKLFQLTQPSVASGPWGYKVLGDGLAAMLVGKQGVFYGVAGYSNSEELVKLTFSKDGTEQKTVLHKFVSPLDGHSVASLLLLGNTLFGATDDGGIVNPLSSNRYGVAFSVDLTTAKETIVERFRAYTGYTPMGLTKDSQGNVYGIQLNGVRTSNGTNGAIFELSPPAPGTSKWTYKLLHNFTGGDGSPYGALTFYKGVLYGGGSSSTGNFGIIYALKPPLKGQTAWRYSVIYNFKGGDDGSATTSLVPDGKGHFYGMTESGGGKKCYYTQFQIGCGTVFMLTP